MHNIAQKQIFFLKLPELDPDPDLMVKYPDLAKRSGSDRLRIRNTGVQDQCRPVFRIHKIFMLTQMLRSVL
jgi:hypothetical protein